MTPKDYDATKERNKILTDKIKQLENSNESIKKLYNDMIESRQEVDEKSKKYDELSEAIENAQGKLNRTQKLISDYTNVIKILRETNDMILKVSGLVYLDISDEVMNDEGVKRDFSVLIQTLEQLTNDLTKKRKQNIIEGDFINV